MTSVLTSRGPTFWGKLRKLLGRVIKSSLLIPEGLYCYDRHGACPYWRNRKNKPEQESGECLFTGDNDWDDGHLSLLWDQCKQCGLNEGPDVFDP